MRRTIYLLLALCTLVVCFATPVNAANGYYGGAASYRIDFDEKESSGILFWQESWTNRYLGTATYYSSFIVLLDNLSGTKYWGNYNNSQGTAQSMTIGVSKQTTVSGANSWTISGNIGYKVPVKAAEISADIGGSYTNSKTYAKTVGTSSAYEINTKSKNGYYAVTHAANCDSYSVNVRFYSGKDPSKNYTITGKLIRFENCNGYERLWYSKSSF